MLLSPADQALRARLEGLGFSVVLLDDDLVRTAPLASTDLFVVSETSASAKILDALKSSAAPVVSLEPAIWDDLGMTGARWGTDFGDATAVAALDVVNAFHPLAAELSGLVTVAGAGGKFVWGTPSVEASVIATLPGQSSRAAIFAYTKGSRLVDGSLAAGRRVGFFAGTPTPSLLTESGWKLFDATIRWAVRSRDALLVSASWPLPAADALLRARVEALGFSVHVRAGAAVTSEDARGKSVVVISESTVSSTVGTRLRDVAAPVLSLEPALFDDFGMTGPTWLTDFGAVPSQTAIEITNSSHPLSANLSGTIRVTRASAKLVWGNPAASAVRIARPAGPIPGSATPRDRAAVIFGYPAGAQMVGLRAPSRRVGWFAGHPAAGEFTALAWRLFDAAVLWTADERRICEGAPNGTACEDGNACTANDRCLAGACVGGSAPQCEPSGQCAVQGCDAALGCTSAPAKDGTSCDDGDPCFTGDACAAGVCVPGTVPVSTCGLIPRVACIANAPGGKRALFGYSNATGSTIEVAAGGAENAFTPAPAQRGQPTAFPPGIREVAFEVEFSEPFLSWKLGGTTVTTANAPPCCQGAPPPRPRPPAGVLVFADGWETCADGWRDDANAEASYVVDAGWAGCSGGVGRVLRVSEQTAGKRVRSSWFQPIAVQESETYCVSVWIRWLHGTRPVVKIERLSAEFSQLGPAAALFGPDTENGLGGRSIPVADSPDFRRYMNEFRMPAGTAFVRFSAGVELDGVRRDAAASEAYFDELWMTRGPCGF